MDEESADGFWSVSAEHLPGLVALVATPVVVVLTVLLCRILADRGFAAAAAGSRRIDALSFLARVAVMSCLAGAAVHASMVSTHWTEERTTALWFAVDAGGFLLAAALTLVMRPGWRAVSFAMLALTSASYIYYVVQRGESADIVGVAMTTVELAGAMLLLQPVAAEVRHQPPAYPWVAAATVPVALLTVFTMTAFADSGSSTSPAAGGQKYIEYRMAPMPGMKHGMAGMSGMKMPAGEGKPLTLPTASLAGAIMWPVSHAAMGAGMTIAELGCTQRPTATQQQAAVSLVDRTTEAVARYRSLAVAKAAGYVPITPSGRTVVHYINLGVYETASPLDPTAVPSLVYVNTPHGAVLSAAMYLMPLGSSSAPPQPGGCLTQWHVHHDLCFRDFAVVGTTGAGTCPAGTVSRVTPAMMHVWLTPVPGGALAMDAGDQDELAAADQLASPGPHNGTA